MAMSLTREAFDRQEPVPATISIVAAYLRHQGEDVATAGATIAVNGELTTARDLVAYANDLRFIETRPPYRLLRDFARPA